MGNNLPEWRSRLASALHRNRAKHHSRYFQLATVSPEGLPKNRTVVFRGFLESTNTIQIITDSRSQKAAQIFNQPWGEICWYFTKTREQFRISGYLQLVDCDNDDLELIAARKAAWQKISDNARSQFMWPNPGEARSDDLTLFTPETPSAHEPVTNFCLLLLTPQKVDHLELREEPQNRRLYQLQSNGNWTIQTINP
ncbi:MAG: pyridoxamine 5'-phosphate oxidase family protein [Xenococcus sp. MO_188.B8]|nr:pyridoxamine 5'-phosphate oxidase family protein [Xenococcus sp. MO_188.B8]